MIRLVVTVVAVAILQMAADVVFKIQWPKEWPQVLIAKGIWMMSGVILMWAIASQRRHGR